jgi:hypothetical protein
MDDKLLLNEIDYWDAEIASAGKQNYKIYELALFKIFVKFELFLSELFTRYSIGKGSSKGYIPERKLAFMDEKHLEGVLKNNRSTFIDYNEKILNLSEHIFINKRNPFSLVFMDAKLSVYYNQIKYIRNYIAHESKEAKLKYQNILGETNEFVEPCIYLTKMNKKYNKTNYSIYIDSIKVMADILLDPTPYWTENVDDSILTYAAITKQE